MVETTLLVTVAVLVRVMLVPDVVRLRRYNLVKRNYAHKLWARNSRLQERYSLEQFYREVL